jgi:hypothetical protein
LGGLEEETGSGMIPILLITIVPHLLTDDELPDKGNQVHPECCRAGWRLPHDLPDRDKPQS